MTKAMPVGSRRIDKFYGYAWIKVSGHLIFKDGWVKEHHLIWWSYKKERIKKGFILHHKDEDRVNNKLSNLELLSRKEHAKLHHIGRRNSSEVRKKMSISAKNRCTTRWRNSVSKRVKQQHKDGNFGRQTWRKL